MKKIKRILILLILLAFPIFCLSCKEEEDPIDIYASIYPVYYLTSNIVGNKMKVAKMYPDGVEVHEYDPIADGEMKSLVEMTEAKLMFYIGAGLEAFIDSAKKSVFSDTNLKLVELCKEMTLYDSVTEELETTEKGTHSVTADVHVWLDPIYMIEMAKIIRDEVVLMDPENESYYSQRLDRLVEKLNSIDKAYKDALENLSFKTMLIDHDAYLYLAKRYQITRIKTRVDNESCDMNPAKMIESINIARDLGIEYIVATKNETVCASVSSIQKEINAQLVYLDPIASLTSQTENKDYYDLMMENLEVFKKIFR